MGAGWRVCKKYEVEYGNEISRNDFEKVIDAIDKLSDAIGESIFNHYDDMDLFIELCYEKFTSAMDKLLKGKVKIKLDEEEKDILDEIYSEVKDNENLKNNGFIKMEWF